MRPADSFGVLIVDDEPNICSGLAKGLASEAEILETAADADEALAKFDKVGYLNEEVSRVVD